MLWAHSCKEPTVRTPTLLLVEDHIPIARQVTEFLENEGWQVDYASRGLQAVELASTHLYDVVVLDLNLPDIDGLEVCARIKQSATANTPVLMLTARDAFDDKARGFGEGADDYVTKPFDLRELALRCEVLARRSQLHQRRELQLGELVIDSAAQRATRQGQELALTAIGFRILQQLVEAHPNPVSRTGLVHAIWGDDPPESDALKSHIYSLRAALDKPFAQPMLKTITNVGYQLVVHDEP